MELETSGGFWLMLGLGMLALPGKWLLGMVLAAAVHELGHLGAIRLTGGRAVRLILKCGGARLLTEPMEPKQELFCALAGPLAGGMLVLAWRWYPELAVSALVQTIFNLLPLPDFDGGRALKCAGKIIKRDIVPKKDVL